MWKTKCASRDHRLIVILRLGGQELFAIGRIEYTSVRGGEDVCELRDT